jgi:murein DD-endopeptidase MepM/ murein hydrolase activator NlpD
MPLFVAICSFIFFATHGVLAQNDYQSDLIQITKTIKAMEQRNDEIQIIIDNLGQEKENLSNTIFEKRFRAVQNLHLYYSTKKSTPLFGFIASKKSFYDRYFEQRYQQSINQILAILLKNDVSNFIELETKIVQIEQFKREQLLLNETLQSALSYLEEIEITQDTNPEIDLMIGELRQQSQSLNDFITQLLNLSPDASYVPNTDEPSFILPASGVIEQAMTGIYIGTNGKALISAPSDGRVLFSDIYKRLGHIVITDHGNGYTSILKGLSKSLVKSGSIILQGDAVGLIDSDGMTTKNAGENSNKAMLYYELRYNGNTVNPIEHLSGL